MIELKNIQLYALDKTNIIEFNQTNLNTRGKFQNEKKNTKIKI